MQHRTEGLAWRVKVLGAGVETVEFYNRYIEVEYGKGVVLVMTVDGSRHEATVPLASTIIQWVEPTAEFDAELDEWTDDVPGSGPAEDAEDVEWEGGDESSRFL